MAADSEITNRQSVPRRSDRRVYDSNKCSGNNNDLGNRKRCKHGGDGDIIVLAGKGHEDYQEIKGVKHHMDERELIADIIKENPDIRL